MKKENNQKQKVKKVILYVILLAILIYVIYAIYLLIERPTDIFTVEEGELYSEETNIGYVIRNEQVLQGQNYKNGIEQIKAEGERTAKDEAIFRYYSSNEKTLKQKISELDVKIQEAMQNDTSIYPYSDMKILENQIDEKIENISKITDVAKLEEYKKEIDDLVSKKSKIAGENSPQGSYLKQLVDERRTYESQLNSGAEYVKAPMSGVVSYRVDGLEQTLTPECFGELTKEYLENLDLKTGKIVAASQESGKIIDNFTCYIATVSETEQAKQAKVGDKVEIRLASSTEIDAEISNVIKEDDGDVILILKIEKHIEELINYRKISFDLIWWSHSGLKVPNQAIVKDNELNYVVRNRAGYLSKILVNVTKQNDKYAIVEPYTTEQLTNLGFSKEQIANNKNISLYDEIIINPDLSKVNN